MRHIRHFLLFLFPILAGAQTPSLDRWAPMGRVDDGSTWLDTTTIARQGAIRYAWTQTRHDSVLQMSGKSYNRTLIRARYNCETGEASLLQIIYYLGDNVVTSVPAEGGQSFSAPPGSMGEMTMLYACGKKRFEQRVATSRDASSTISFWRLLSRVDTAGKTVFLSVDTSSVILHGSMARAHWKEVTVVSPPGSGGKLLEFFAQSVFNCEANEIRWLAYSIYVDGNRVSGQDTEQNVWRPAPPSSSPGNVLRLACNLKRPSQHPPLKE